MTSNNNLFFIPIYRQTKEKYHSELNDDFKKYEQSITKELNDKDYLEHFHEDKVREKRYERWVNSEGISYWELNQIIGWIELFLHGIIIKANLWFINSKKITKRPKRKIIEYKGKLGDVTSIEFNNNAEIKTDILKFIDNAQKGLYGFELEKYHINSKWLLNIIDYLDIKSLVESNLKR